MAARIPKTVGAYEVGELLGKGGMGEVYKARHDVLDRASALKRLVLPDNADAAEQKLWRERFQREGRALAKIQHESIVAVYDLIEKGSEQWLAMELVDGFNVGELTKGGAVPIDVACMIGLGVARALEAAHRAGVVHRDVKPQNIIVSRTGVVKLMDFGVARDASLDTLTKTGSVVGTPTYIAPELLKGQSASAKSDVYAAGAVLYELLSGKRLFSHATPESIWGMVASGKWVRLGKIAPHIPWRLTLLVERCLKLEPKRRPASASELKQALELFLTTHDAPADEGARLVSWLCAIGKIVEAEALTVVEDTSLFVEVVPLKKRGHPWRTAALIGLATTAALAFVLAEFTDVIDRVRAAVPW